MGEPPKRLKFVDVRREEAILNHARLKSFYELISMEDLQNPQCVVEVYNFSEQRSFFHMGRSLTKELVDFIQKERPARVSEPRKVIRTPGQKLNLPLNTERQLPLDIYGFRFITGTPGAGKTCSLAAAVQYLYGMFASERVRNPSFQRRIMLVDGGELGRCPEDALWKGFFQAFVDDAAALAELETRRAGQISVFDVENFLKKRRAVDSLIIVVDDGNKLPKGSAGQELLCSLNRYCVVVFCASVSSEWTRILRHPKATQYKLVCGGFDSDELQSYLETFGLQNPVDTSRTGSVPRLMELLDTDTRAFEKAIATLKEEINTFIKNNVGRQQQREQVMKELTGVYEVPQLPLLLETKCFYQGADGRLKALTPMLQSYARSTIVEVLQEDNIDEKWKVVDMWLQAIHVDSNVARIGWNAEMAGILALKFMEQGFYYATDARLELNTKHVRGFSGPMRRSLLSAQRPLESTLHLPYEYDHAGLDAYFETEEYIGAVQFSVAKNALYHHRDRVRKAEELFAGDHRIKLLIWVIHTNKWLSYLATSKRDESIAYYYVVMPFQDLSAKLAAIDEALDQLRKDTARKASEVCSSCILATEVDANNWVQCDFCDRWYHQSCVSYECTPMQKVQILRQRSASQPNLSDPDSSEHPPREGVNSDTDVPYKCPAWRCGRPPAAPAVT